MQVVHHDCLQRLAHQADMGELGSSRNKPRDGFRPRVGVIRRVIDELWRNRWIPEHGVDDAMDGPRRGFVVLLDRTEGRRHENDHLVNVLLGAGYLPMSPKLGLSAKVLGTARAIFALFAYPLAVRASFEWRADVGGSPREELRHRGIHLERGSPKFAVVAENYCLVDLLIRDFARLCQKQPAAGVCLYRNGGWQVASSVVLRRRMRPRTQLFSVLVVHSSRTGMALPEACVFADRVIVRSEAQRHELDVGVAPVVALGRFGVSASCDERIPTPVETGRRGRVLVAFTHRLVEEMTEAEWRDVLRLLEWLAARANTSVRLRFKQSQGIGRAMVNRGAPPWIGTCIASGSLSDDLAWADLVVVIAAFDYVSTVLQDAAFADVPVVNTVVGRSHEPKTNPSALQAATFVPFGAVLSMQVEELVDRATRSRPASSENESQWSDAGFLAEIEAVVTGARPARFPQS